MTQQRTITIEDFLTPEQIKMAAACFTAKDICERVVMPNMPAIEAKLGQECDAMYLSYATEFTFRQTGVWK